jgi:hypothetical protein
MIVRRLKAWVYQVKIWYILKKTIGFRLVTPDVICPLTTFVAKMILSSFENSIAADWCAIIERISLSNECLSVDK